MVTITFYSYKGGVGRTLALANIAKRLSEFNKKTCIIDFDIEAPGLHFKFKNELKDFNFKAGIVEFIDYFITHNQIPESIKDYFTTINLGYSQQFPIEFMPAGNVYGGDYWNKKNNIDWKKLFKDNNDGILLFLALKKMIENELNPDYLLIDSRTGMTEIFGISVGIMADKVVVVATNNDENLEAASMIINHIMRPEIHITNEKPDIILALSRIPQPSDEKEKLKEEIIKKEVLKRITNLNEDKLVIIHSDRNLEYDESLKIGYKNYIKEPIQQDYLDLFNKIFSEYLSDDEKKKFDLDYNIEKLSYEATVTKDNNKKIEYLNKAIEINSEDVNVYYGRGFVYSEQKEFINAIKDFSKIIEINPNAEYAYTGRGNVYYNQKEYEKAIADYNKAIEINPNYEYAYTGRGLVYFAQKEYEKATADYNKVIEMLKKHL